MLVAFHGDCRGVFKRKPTNTGINLPPQRLLVYCINPFFSRGLYVSAKLYGIRHG